MGLHSQVVPDAVPGMKFGMKFGNYKLKQKLGEGGMGDVYLGEHAMIGRKVAIKVLHSNLTQDPAVVARFLTEARIVSELNHPNIVDVTDFGEEHGRYYIIMELLVGETLDQRLGRSRPSEGDAVHIAQQVANATHAAHRAGVVHRDIKPENIFLVSQNDDPSFVKLVDFGIAKVDDAKVAAAHRTQVGMIIGTPCYMSPEQCLADPTLDHRSDVYSLGIVLYEMVAGTLPFTGDNVAELMTAHIYDPPQPPVSLNRELSPHVNDAILCALAKKPSQRHASMEHFCDAIDTHNVPAHPVEPAVTATAILTTPTTRSTTPDATPPSLPPETKTQADTLQVRLASIVRERLDADRLPMPAMRANIVRCLELTEDRSQTFESIASCLALDRTLLTQIMREADQLGQAMRHTTIVPALRRLGMRQLRRVLLQSAIRDIYHPGNARLKRLFGGQWKSTLAVGRLARDLARLGGGRVAPEQAFLAGLAHNAGSILIGSFLLDVERSMSSGRWLDDGVFRHVVQQSYALASGSLCEAWELGESVASGARNFSNYDLQRPNACGNVVRLARAVANTHQPGTLAPPDDAAQRIIDTGCELLALRPQEVAKVGEATCRRDSGTTRAWALNSHKERVPPIARRATTRR